MNELTQVQVTTQLGTITNNLAEVEKDIKAAVEEYKSIVVTEDNIPASKRLLAQIRKEKDTLDRQRKDIKKEWMKPYEAFETEAKRVIALYDEPIDLINGQLSEYEARRVAERKQLIEDIYEELKGEYGDWLPLSSIYSTKWENKGTDEKTIREEIQLQFDSLHMAIDTIKSLKSEFENDALAIIKNGGSLQDAINRISELREQKERFEAAAREKALRELEEKARLEELKKAAEEAAKAEPEEVIEEPEEELLEVDIPEDIAEFGDTAPFETVADDFMAPPEDEPFEVVPATKNYKVVVKVPEEYLEFVERNLTTWEMEYEVIENA